MKRAEYHEGITANLRKIKRNSDLDSLYKLTELCVRLQSGTYDKNDSDLFMVVNVMLCGNLNNQNIRLLANKFVRSASQESVVTA